MSVPAQCTKCGTIFWSRQYDFTMSKRLRLGNNWESCIASGCSGMARLADGLFDFTSEGIEVLSAPEITHEMIAALRKRISSKRNSYTSVDELRKDISEIHPSFSQLIAGILTNQEYLIGGIGLILSIIQIWIALSQNQSIQVERAFFGPTTVVEQHFHDNSRPSTANSSLDKISAAKQQPDAIRDEARAAVRRWMLIPKSKPVSTEDHQARRNKNKHP